MELALSSASESLTYLRNLGSQLYLCDVAMFNRLNFRQQFAASALDIEGREGGRARAFDLSVFLCLTVIFLSRPKHVNLHLLGPLGVKLTRRPFPGHQRSVDINPTTCEVAPYEQIQTTKSLSGGFGMG